MFRCGFPVQPDLPVSAHAQNDPRRIFTFREDENNEALSIPTRLLLK